MSWTDSYVAWDTETTGLGKDARIVEIAFVQFEKGEVKEEWSSLLKPEGVDWANKDVQKALEINHIEQKDLENKPSFMDVFHHVAAYLRGTDVWVAHNQEFDRRMLNQEYQFHKKMDFPILPKLSFCTMHLSGKVHPTERSHRLQAVAPRWGVTQEGAAHRASSDAITCGRILYAMHLKNALPVEAEAMEVFYKEASAAWKSNSGRRQNP